MLKDNYSLLIEKLDAFIRRFYINQLLRGALYTVGAVLGLFVLLNVLEYYFYFSTGVRSVMFWSFIALSGASLYRWVALPLMHYFHLGKVISHEQAALIIGDHFADVKDKLLNILQLKQQSNNAIYAELITASINQKSNEIRLVPFQAAIDLAKNRKYLRYALPPVLLPQGRAILRFYPESYRRRQCAAQRGVYQPRQRTIPTEQGRCQYIFVHIRQCAAEHRFQSFFRRI